MVAHGERILAPKKQQKEKWVGTWEEAQEEDGLPGGARQTESREVTTSTIEAQIESVLGEFGACGGAE